MAIRSSGVSARAPPLLPAGSLPQNGLGILWKRNSLPMSVTSVSAWLPPCCSNERQRWVVVSNKAVNIPSPSWKWQQNTGILRATERGRTRAEKHSMRESGSKPRREIRPRAAPPLQASQRVYGHVLTSRPSNEQPPSNSKISLFRVAALAAAGISIPFAIELFVHVFGLLPRPW